MNETIRRGHKEKDKERLVMKYSRLIIGTVMAAVVSLSATQESFAVVVRHGGAAVHRGGAHVNVNRNLNVNRNVHRNVNVNRNVYRHGVVGGVRVGWARPAYRWGPGGAIAAGAAIGFVAAATAAAWAPAPPQPGLCWYYTDASQRNGFWDNCP